MAFPTAPAETDAVPLETVLERLRASGRVDGILLMGSTGTRQVTATSDLDILLVLTDLPVPAKLIATWIDGRLAEVYCTTVAAIRRATVDPAHWSAGTDEEALIRWMRSGRVVHDRSGSLQAGQEAAQRVPPAVLDESAIYGGWWGIGYNVAHMRRYASSPDPTVRSAAALRLTWSVFQVVAHYFTMRKIPWRGEKAAVAFLMAHDPVYFDLLQRCLTEVDVRRKAALYEELAQMTLQPVGGLWTHGETAVEIGPGFGTGAEPTRRPIEGDAESALAFWRDLLADTPLEPS